jgi:hypothetical protein
MVPLVWAPGLFWLQVTVVTGYNASVRLDLVMIAYWLHGYKATCGADYRVGCGYNTPVRLADYRVGCGYNTPVRLGLVGYNTPVRLGLVGYNTPVRLGLVMGGNARCGAQPQSRTKNRRAAQDRVSGLSASAGA